MSAIAKLMEKKRLAAEAAKLKSEGTSKKDSSADGGVNSLAKKMEALRLKKEEEERAKKAEEEKHNKEAPWERQFAHEQKVMSALGMNIRKVDGDGACLFRSFACVFEEGGEGDHAVVRKKCVDFMRGHEEDFAPFIEDSFPSYLTEMSHPTSWGGDIEIQALSKVYGCNVLVHIPSTYQIPEVDNEKDKNPFAHYQTYETKDTEKLKQRRKVVREGIKSTEGDVMSVPQIVRASAKNEDTQIIEMKNFGDSAGLVQLAYHPYYHSGKHYNLVEVAVGNIGEDASGKGKGESGVEVGKKIGKVVVGKWEEDL